MALIIMSINLSRGSIDSIDTGSGDGEIGPGNGNIAICLP